LTLAIKKIEDYTPFVAVDGSEVVEVIGLSTTNTRDVSLAYATVRHGQRTTTHQHDFTEIYVIKEGEGLMRMQDKTRHVKENDNILIPPRSWHSIENRGKENLTIICICTPAFSEEKTKMKNFGQLDV